MWVQVPPPPFHVLLYDITVHTGQFAIVKNSIASLTSDRRIQALLIAFSFGAFIEGAAGFGTPVAICAALLMGLGFPPLYAASLCLIANTAPVAFGAIGIPILTLGAIAQQDPFILGQMAGRQLPFVSLVIPIWLVVTMSGWRGFLGVWPVVLVSGGSFAIVQFFWSNFIGPELVDIAGGLISLVVTAAFATRWKPKDNWDFQRYQNFRVYLPLVLPVHLNISQGTSSTNFSDRLKISSNAFIYSGSQLNPIEYCVGFGSLKCQKPGFSEKPGF